MADLPHYPLSLSDDLDPTGSGRLPVSLRVVRWTAVAQSVAGGGVAAWLWRQAAVISPAGDGDWSQIPQAALRFGGIAVATAALTIAIPAVLLRLRGPAPRIVLLVIESVVGMVLLVALPASLGANGQAGLKALVTAALVGVVTTLVAASRPTARAWSSDRRRD